MIDIQSRLGFLTQQNTKYADVMIRRPRGSHEVGHAREASWIKPIPSQKQNKLWQLNKYHADVMELVDVLDSKSCEGNLVPVRPRPSADFKGLRKKSFFSIQNRHEVLSYSIWERNQMTVLLLIISY